MPAYFPMIYVRPFVSRVVVDSENTQPKLLLNQHTCTINSSYSETLSFNY